jgi:hypothetical protein
MKLASSSSARWWMVAALWTALSHNPCVAQELTAAEEQEHRELPAFWGRIDVDVNETATVDVNATATVAPSEDYYPVTVRIWYSGRFLETRCFHVYPTH